METTMYNTLLNKLNERAMGDEELLRHMEDLLAAHHEKVTPIHESRSLSGIFADNNASWVTPIPPYPIIGTGFNRLDQLTGGFLPGEFVVFGGRPAMGKTQFCINMALFIARSFPLLYVSWDLPVMVLAKRFLSALTGIATSRLIRQTLLESEVVEIHEKGSALFDTRIMINDSCASSVSAMRSLCEQEAQNNGIRVVVVDYLQLMTASGFRNNREQEICYITGQLKSIARDFGLVVIAVSQLSRSPERRSMSARPILADLRESGSIEQHADKVLLMYRPEYYGIDVDEYGNSIAGLVEIIVAKNRNDRPGTISLYRDKEMTRFM